MKFNLVWLQDWVTAALKMLGKDEELGLMMDAQTWFMGKKYKSWLEMFSGISDLADLERFK